MIPPNFFAAQLQAAQRRAHEGMQAVPSMESDVTVGQTDSLFAECVLDLSKYLTSSDLPATPREFFDDLFHEKLSTEALHKPLPGVIKIKEEPDSTATSRCSTPESLLPEHDFDNGDFPTPQFRENGGNVQENKGESLMCQLQSIHHSNQSSDVESDEEINVENLDINSQQLKAALVQFEQSSQDDMPGQSGNVNTHRNTLKSPQLNKLRKSIKKGSDEYIVKRERNNVAVRKSRTKAKLKHIETQMRVGELTEENEQLRNRVASLQKELNALKSFITYNCPNNVKAPFSSYPPIFSSTKIM